ncbi:hypothetical protein J7L48_06055, partial [bacterium]|nr:hypothetical protein [bacterium]
KLLLERSGFTITKIFYQRNIADIFKSIGFILKYNWKAEKIGKWFINYPNNGGFGSLLQILLYPLALFQSTIRQSGRITIISIPKRDNE